MIAAAIPVVVVHIRTHRHSLSLSMSWKREVKCENVYKISLISPKWARRDYFFHIHAALGGRAGECENVETHNFLPFCPLAWAAHIVPRMCTHSKQCVRSEEREPKTNRIKIVIAFLAVVQNRSMSCSLVLGGRKGERERSFVMSVDAAECRVYASHTWTSFSPISLRLSPPRKRHCAFDYFIGRKTNKTSQRKNGSQLTKLTPKRSFSVAAPDSRVFHFVKTTEKHRARRAAALCGKRGEGGSGLQCVGGERWMVELWWGRERVELR